MEELEKIAKLSGKANISTEEAREALEQCNWDILDAMIYLERNGKTEAPKKECFDTNVNKNTILSNVQAEANEEEELYKEKQDVFKNLFIKIWEWLKRIVSKGNRNFFVVKKNYEDLIQIPITVMVILLLLFLKPTIIIILISLVIGFRYHFEGPDMKAQDVNDVFEKVSDKVEDIKNDIKTKKK